MGFHVRVIDIHSPFSISQTALRYCVIQEYAEVIGAESRQTPKNVKQFHFISLKGIKKRHTQHLQCCGFPILNLSDRLDSIYNINDRLKGLRHINRVEPFWIRLLNSAPASIRVARQDTGL